MPDFHVEPLLHVYMFIYIWLLRILIRMYKRQDAVFEAYNIGLLVSLMSCMFPPYLFLLPMVLVCMLLVHAFSMRTFLATLLGMLTVIIMETALHYLCCGDLRVLWVNLASDLSFDAMSFVWQDWMPLFVLSLLLIICVGVLGYAIYLLRRSKEVKEVKVKQEFILPHEEAKRNIEKLKTKYDSGDFTSKDYYTELVSILRDYVTQRYGFSAKEMTSYELVEHLINVPEDKTEKNAGPENNLLANNDKQVNLEELREILTTADLTKFAKLKTEANEDRTNLMRLAGYIDATKNETQRYYYTPVQKEKAQKQIKPGIVLKICLVLFSVAIVAVVAFMVKEVLELFL